eukprot:TRINITY_DN9921_c0_g2_i1.p1 TRINITY_DN9921_c0_g2~~TRINITY_DN9921_c0_g2_i1.p1  ORF type:complete len:404 (+),score=49.08 TRINITY_DN9921_c0_g2_i1:313-1524(+)
MQTRAQSSLTWWNITKPRCLIFWKPSSFMKRLWKPARNVPWTLWTIAIVGCLISLPGRPTAISVARPHAMGWVGGRVLSFQFRTASVDALINGRPFAFRLRDRTEDDIERELKLEAEAAALNEQSGSQQLRYQTRTLAFDISIKAVGVFRYLTDSITKLPLATMTRILNNHDFPTLLVTLLDTTPWVRYDEGKLYKYIDSKWTEIAASDRFQLTQLEGQLWLAAYNLLMEPECRRKYEYNSHNKQEILKLKGHLNAVLLDQLPILTELRRSLEELSLLEPPAAQSGIVLEQLPELKLHLETTNKGKWASIAAYQYNNVFSPKEDTRKMQAKLLASTYNLDHLEAVFPEEPKCAVCGEDAVMRCSACSSEWYCRRQCQVEHWPKHKELCKKLSQALKAQRDESG